MMAQHVLQAQFPRDAHLTVPNDTSLEVVATYSTRRGLRSAERKARAAVAEYRAFRGNAAAYALYLDGERVSLADLRRMADVYEEIEEIEETENLADLRRMADAYEEIEEIKETENLALVAKHLRRGGRAYFMSRDATLQWWTKTYVRLDADGDLVQPHPTDTQGTASAPADVTYHLEPITADRVDGGSFIPGAME